MVVEDPKCRVGESLLGGGTECAETCSTNREGSLMEEFGSLGGVRAGGNKVATVQFCRGEINQHQYPVTALGRVGIAHCRGKHLACLAVVASPEEDAAGGGGQLRGAVVVKRRRGGTATRLVEGSARDRGRHALRRGRHDWRG